MMKSRRPKKITSRISSVTNGFVQAIIPIVTPTTAETDEVLSTLGMTRDDMSCVYCGGKATDWDHLMPLVRGKKPSGHLHESRNIVPCCGPCNQSKGGRYWKDWMEGKAPGGPKAKGVLDVQSRIQKLEKFERWANPKKFSFKEIIGEQKWRAYWGALQEIESRMKEAQILAEEIQKIVEREYQKQISSP